MTRKYSNHLPSPIDCADVVCSTGYGNHGDYVFGWKDDSLQQIMDEECYVNCKTMKTQSFEAMNACSVPKKVDEDVGDTNCKFRTCRALNVRVLLTIPQGLKRFRGNTQGCRLCRCERY